MTTQEISDMIAEKLKRYLKEQPIVTVRLVNYKISVIGEVNHPGIYTVNNGQVNLLEAIAMAGDLTIYGKRNNVRIIRKENNRQRLITVNLNDVICLPYAPDPFSLTAGYEEIFDKDFVEWADSPAEEADLSAEK